MSWIKTIPLSEANAQLNAAIAAQRNLYPPEYSTAVPGLPEQEDQGIVAAHSLIPEALLHAFSTFGSLMATDLPLNRRQHELIASAVSLTNRTHYCSVSHVEFLRRATGDEALARAISDNLSTAPLNAADRAIVEYAVQITRDATCVNPDFHQRLREAGFDDRGILQITLIAAWFNYINRVADALGWGGSQQRFQPENCGRVAGRLG